MTGMIPNTGRRIVRPPGLGGLTVELSTFVPQGSVVVADRRSINILDTAGRVLFVNPTARDRYGSPSWLVRALDPHPGYTRHTLGDRELERDHRRARRAGGRP